MRSSFEKSPPVNCLRHRVFHLQQILAVDCLRTALMVRNSVFYNCVQSVSRALAVGTFYRCAKGFDGARVGVQCRSVGSANVKASAFVTFMSGKEAAAE